MATTVSAAKAKAEFAECMRKAEAGDPVVITRHGKAVVALVRADRLQQLERLRSVGPAAGLAGLLGRGEGLHRWSTGWARSATLFWLTSLLFSLWAMETSWNGLYLAEPRWRLGVQFGVVAILLQLAILLIRRPPVASAVNAAFFAALAFVGPVVMSVRTRWRAWRGR